MATGGIEGETFMSMPDERAMEEWRLLQSIISRHETIEFQIRGWLLVLLVALVAALYADRTRLNNAAFGGIGAALVLLFLVMELIVRIPKRLAIRRVALVEAMLRGEKEYDGPGISLSLANRVISTKQPDRTMSQTRLLWDEIRIALVWLFYVVLLLVVAIITFLS
jgi:hypothetical protein